ARGGDGGPHDLVWRAGQLAEEGAYRVGTARAISTEGALAYVLRDLREAERLFRAAEHHFAELGLQHDAAQELAGVGFAARDQGDFDGAATALERASRCARAGSDRAALTHG